MLAAEDDQPPSAPIVNDSPENRDMMLMAISDSISMVVQKAHLRTKLVAARGEDANNLMQGIQAVRLLD